MKRLITFLCVTILVGNPVDVKADQFGEGYDAYGLGNYQKALEILKPLAEKGDTRAQHTLGNMYFYGKGVSRDGKEAIKWFRKTADQGNADVQIFLGMRYYLGEGIPQDYIEAAKWFRIAAEQGFATAQFHLGLMYTNGQGVLQDNVQAHKWFNLSASLYHGEARKDAVKNRDIIEKKMKPDQVLKAQKLAREWKPKTWKELSQQK